MGDKGDSVLDKAEGLARRVLERLGSTLEGKPGSQADEAALTHREISDLTSRIEREIEAGLRVDRDGVKRLAPNHIRVGLTYERVTRLSKEYLDALAAELKSATFEFITNRRYTTPAPLSLVTESDLFAKSTVIKVEFAGEAGPSAATPASGTAKGASPAAQTLGGRRTLSLASSSGQRFQVTMVAGGAPATIGRTASNAIHLDDPDVSRMHCSISIKPSGEIVVADLGSANGTTVNGRMLGRSEACPLNKGDVIGVGDLRLTVIEMD